MMFSNRSYSSVYRYSIPINSCWVSIQQAIMSMCSAVVLTEGGLRKCP